MSATMVGRRQKFLKLDWLKHLKIVSKKRNLHQKINNSKSHIQSLSFSFRFSSRKSQSPQKLPKKITHFTIQFDSKNINSNLNSLNSLAKWLSFCLRTKWLQDQIPLQSLILLQHCQKLLILQMFQQIFALHHFQTPKNCIFQVLERQMSAYSCITLSENFCSRDVGSFCLV